MGMDMGSIRLSRLNRLMNHMLSHSSVTGRELIESLGYSSMRMLQRDISYLRNEYSVDITYDYSRRAYTCRDSGNFVLHFSLTRKEAVLLLASLSVTKKLLLTEGSRDLEDLWDKLRIIIPGDIKGISGLCITDMKKLMTEKGFKKYQWVMGKIDRVLA